MSALYDKAREAFGNALIDWVDDDVRAILIDTAAYTVDLANHDFLNDLAGGARIGSAVQLLNKSNVAGVMDAEDISFTGLSSAPSLEALILYQHTGNEATSRLIAYIDSATGLPTVAGLARVDVAWSNGANKIFKL
jgi:hypothetical protein